MACSHMTFFLTRGGHRKKGYRPEKALSQISPGQNVSVSISKEERVAKYGWCLPIRSTWSPSFIILETTIERTETIIYFHILALGHQATVRIGFISAISGEYLPTQKHKLKMVFTDLKVPRHIPHKTQRCSYHITFNFVHCRDACSEEKSFSPAIKTLLLLPHWSFPHCSYYPFLSPYKFVLGNITRSFGFLWLFICWHFPYQYYPLQVSHEIWL